MNIIDTHTHAYEDDCIKEINDNPDIESVINIGMDITTSKRTIEIANQYSKFYSAVGVHPLRVENSRINNIFELATSNKVVAIGEIGLDSNGNIDKQIEYFIKQINIANELRLPVIIHSNNTNKIVLEIFKKIKPKYGCVFHCFQPDLDDLKEILDYGYYISFAGRITYKTARKSIEVAKVVPDDKFLIETDSPYISPEPYKGLPGKTEYIKYVVEKLAEIKETTSDEIVRLTNENTKKLFKKL